MPRRKIYLVSPREPSGATWLINCLLELGVMTYRYSPAGMWRQEGGRWLVNPHERVLRKWLPALSDHENFAFRGDLEVQWMHEWFTEEYAASEMLYFVRDPRDALYSRYKREAPQLSYREFAAFPDVYTLLDKVTNWWLYTSTWLTHPRLSVCRFEDYKADAATTLARVLDALQLHYDSARIEDAVRYSTFERAAAAEAAYRAERPEDTQLINRSGQPKEWLAGGMDTAVLERIEGGCGDLLSRLGYPHASAAPRGAALGRHAARLDFFSRVKGLELGPEGGALDEAQDGVSLSVARFAATLSPDLLERACLPAHELQQLHASLREYLQRLGEEAGACFTQAMPPSTQPDPEVMPLSLMRRGLWRRVRRVLGTGA